MKIKNVLEYKLKGERNNRPRRPLIISDKVFIIFVYDKKGFIESRIQCLDIADLSLKWEYTHPHVINNLVSTGKNDLIAGCMDGELLNFNAHDGTVIWKFKVPKGNIGLVSNEENTRVVFSGIQGNKSTWCIDTASGEVLWTVPNDGHSYRPYIYQGKILNSIGNDLYCLDLHSGETVWKVSEPSTYLFNPGVVSNLVMASGHGLINFYDLSTGKLVSSIQTGQPTDAAESGIREIIFDEHAIYFGDAKGLFYSYSLPDAQNGYHTKLRWKTETNGAIESIPAFYQNAILVINNGKQFLRIDKNSGDVTQEIKTKGEAGTSGITVDKDDIFYSYNGGTVVKCTV
jgi:outer membrane protein assembly factor BamB